jgi:hypothetical protein
LPQTLAQDIAMITVEINDALISAALANALTP